MKKYTSLSLALLFSSTLIAMDEPAAADIIAGRETNTSNASCSSIASLKAQLERAAQSMPNNFSDSHKGHGCLQDPLRGQRHATEEKSELKSPSIQSHRPVHFTSIPAATPRNPLFNSPELAFSMKIFDTLVLIPESDRKEIQLEQLKQNANDIHDTLQFICPLFLSWLKEPDVKLELPHLIRLNNSLRAHADTQDTLLTHEIKISFAPTQAFQRLYVIAKQLETARKTVSGDAHARRDNILKFNPEHVMSNFERTFTPLYNSIEDIKKSVEIRPIND